LLNVISPTTSARKLKVVERDAHRVAGLDDGEIERHGLPGVMTAGCVHW